ncbi:MAG TPA: hypothetical protein VIT88_03960 [Pyrinomonadaceae bacterium]
MNKTLKSLIHSYREYRTSKSKSKAYRALRYVIVSAVIGYLLLLSFPQVLFANEVSYGNLTVYSREPMDQNIYAVLDSVNAKLAASTINDSSLRPKIFLTNSHGMYSSMSLYVGGNSFGKGFAMLPTNNIFINRSDVSKDLVFRRATEHSQRSLSGVVAHEVTHLLVKEKFGYWRNLTMPSWKKEGYAEYVAGGSTLPYETGVKMWKSNPSDGTGYQYFKYYMLVKYLLETEKLSVEDLFNREFDLNSLEATVLKTL